MGLTALSEQTALVTGAGQRIGRAIALALAAEGARLVLHYRDSAAQADALRQELLASGAEAFTLRADLAVAADRDSLVPRAADLAGGLDLLVNSAAGFPPSRLETLTLDEITSNVEVNAWAPFVLCRAFREVVGRGRIVNLLDTRVTGYDWGHVGYLLSKQMLAALTRMLALDFAPEITVNAVAPGLILPPPGQEDSYLEALIHTVPLHKHGDAEDIAAAVVFLLRSDFITGATLFVDGGRHLREYGHG
jgi:NAD(P)-dependent dehydrogenase (short-subunit alcohol dehydrogenase family)